MKEDVVVYVDSDLEDLIPGFLKNRYGDVEVIKKLLKEEDLAEIQRLGHSMKGSGGGYGFDEISEIGKGIEEAAKNCNTQEIEKLNNILAGYLSSVKVVYQDEE
ncbi:MAG: Hpt domain-containing protein [bacterium]